MGSQIHFETDEVFFFLPAARFPAFAWLNPSPLTRCNSVFTGNTTPTSAFCAPSQLPPPPPLPPPPSLSLSVLFLLSFPSAETPTSLVSHKSHLHVAAVSERSPR